MAKVVKKVLNGRHWNNKYPWHEWLDGQCWELIPGKDFDKEPSKFRTTAYTTAIRLGCKVTVSIEDGKLYLQAKKKEVI